MYYKIVSLKMWIYACEGGHILYRRFPLMHVVLDYNGYSSDYVIWFPSTFWMADYKMLSSDIQSCMESTRKMLVMIKTWIVNVCIKITSHATFHKVRGYRFFFGNLNCYSYLNIYVIIFSPQTIRLISI